MDFDRLGRARGHKVAQMAGFRVGGDRGVTMTIAGLLIVGAVGYGLWHLGGAFCKWRLQRFFDSGA
jgi:hypothetical protein